jgi:uncharacterized protein YndB with AHSA1/START domain
MDIIYVIHIAATPEKVWEALTDPESLRQNWGRIESPWTVGSKVTEVSPSGDLLWQGDVRRSEPPRRLSYGFDVTGIGEPPTTVTFEIGPPASPIAPGAQIVRLTLTQTGFEPYSKLRPECARAWTEILSSVKTYVETGRPLGFAWKH